jgi:crotonobetainyl-CoA:carnitine CoA-transferase CaiB-like acyl-CoA transferase
MIWLDLNKQNRYFELPQTGQHTADILKEIGYTDEDLKDLIDNKIVRASKEFVKSKL